jgi:hypothetical protein
MRLNGAGRLAAGLAGLALAGWTPPASAAAQALVIGNGDYMFLPALPACPAAAKLVASRLRGAGFAVIEKQNLPSGAMQAAFGAFGRSLAASPDSTAVIYVCGYASTFNDRDFLLPVSAIVARPSDALAQGMLAKSVINALPAAVSGAVVLDSIPRTEPGAPSPGFAILRTTPLPEGMGIVAAMEAQPGDGPTPVANALAAGLKGSRLAVADLIAGMQAAVPPTTGAQFAVLRAPTAPALLIGAPAPPPPPLPRAEVRPPPSAPTPPPPALAPAAEEGRMTAAERRRVQIDLAQLGYYDGRIDGVFGANTRAAIRRYQHELRADMTGTLTPDQAARLFAAVQ